MQGDYAQAKLSAWERERAIRLEAKHRREKLEAAKRHPAPASYIPKPAAKTTGDEEKRPEAKPRGAPEKASPCVMAKPWLAPKMHSLAVPKASFGKAPRTEMMPEVDDDALSVASDSTCSEHDEEGDDDGPTRRLVDSLDLSVAFATPPKAQAKDETPVVAAYGGGAHVRVGTRTAPGDRCSLEKRRATASVQATRVRKGPIETPSLEKPAKADKVVVKKEFAFLFT
ncbi:hypothetical protein SDRG_10452 [Saprolegnia diclina VS20]|uniref:Uncharacterized protein n=1 Tax=Saprolegnia diclina (strain VS20) TaxID=1156394 RepID=T0QBA8_SAPDV|nr:hypothetical protein SDRG_10452 [Saprolegnia diclina VS20]EQC31936.1 hypothetical protein SDRG_10452 [Saprolegnia diclina VS20]|eukprot:XP_008614664.1 hypothetical protein SDRG_10452 [Saprolegnia diclina VS20]